MADVVRVRTGERGEKAKRMTGGRLICLLQDPIYRNFQFYKILISKLLQFDHNTNMDRTLHEL
ncbi:hypothetical protein ACS0TY_020062 [Phlomoides rotata]